MTLRDGREELREQRVVGVAQQREQVAVQLVIVTLAPARRLVHHLARKVRDGLTEDEANVRSAYLRVGGYRIRMAVGYEVRHAAREELLDLGLRALLSTSNRSASHTPTSHVH